MYHLLLISINKSNFIPRRLLKPYSKITRTQKHIDIWIDLLQSTIGSQMQEIIEFMQRGNVKNEKREKKHNERKSDDEMRT